MVRVRAPLGAGFREISRFSPPNFGKLFRCLCPCARYFILTCFTLLRCKRVSGRTEMVVCTISSKHRNGCRTICCPWSSNGTLAGRSSVLNLHHQLELSPLPPPLASFLPYVCHSISLSSVNPSVSCVIFVVIGIKVIGAVCIHPHTLPFTYK